MVPALVSLLDLQASAGLCPQGLAPCLVLPVLSLGQGTVALFPPGQASSGPSHPEGPDNYAESPPAPLPQAGPWEKIPLPSWSSFLQ